MILNKGNIMKTLLFILALGFTGLAKGVTTELELYKQAIQAEIEEAQPYLPIDLGDGVILLNMTLVDSTVTFTYKVPAVTSGKKKRQKLVDSLCKEMEHEVRVGIIYIWKYVGYLGQPLLEVRLGKDECLTKV